MTEDFPRSSVGQPASCSVSNPHSRLKWLARRTLQRCCRLLLAAWARPLPLAPADAILVIAPHQDDETLGCGGLIATRRRLGAPVGILYVSDGGASQAHCPREELVATREAEARRAMGSLGVEPTAMVFAGARDGELDRLAPSERDRCVTEIRAAIRSLNPTWIFTPCERDGSTEHAAVFRMVREALAGLPGRSGLLQYPVWAWWNPRFLLPIIFRCRRRHRCDFPEEQAAKAEALTCYRSQVEPWGRDGAVLSSDFLRSFNGSREFFFES